MAIEPHFYVKYIIADEDGYVDSDDAVDIAWPSGVPLPECGEIFGLDDVPYQVYDRQWHHHISHDGSHLHFTMVLGEPDEGLDED